MERAPDRRPLSLLLSKDYPDRGLPDYFSNSIFFTPEKFPAVAL
jgi:hypothetical protein